LWDNSVKEEVFHDILSGTDLFGLGEENKDKEKASSNDIAKDSPDELTRNVHHRNDSELSNYCLTIIMTNAAAAWMISVAVRMLSRVYRHMLLYQGS